MKNKICLVYLAVVPYLILAMVTVHWYEYYRPSPTTLAFEPFLFVFTILMYPVIGVLLALLHIIPKSVYGTKWARSIMAVNFMVPIAFWSIYYSGFGGLGVNMLFFIKVPSFTTLSLLLMGYYIVLLMMSFKKGQ